MSCPTPYPWELEIQEFCDIISKDEKQHIAYINMYCANKWVLSYRMCYEPLSLLSFWKLFSIYHIHFANWNWSDEIQWNLKQLQPNQISFPVHSTLYSLHCTWTFGKQINTLNREHHPYNNIISYQLKLTKIHANLNNCAVSFLSRASTNLCWYDYLYYNSEVCVCVFVQVLFENS